MEKFYLEKPSLKRKEDILDYFKEFTNYNSDINGSGMLIKVLEGYTFEEALDGCLKCEEEEFAKSVNRLQSKTFLLIRENDNKLIGMINIRWNIDEESHLFRGHIGYGIRPTERRKGYNKINLYLGLIEAQKLGLNKIFIACEDSNIPSNKTLKALGGELKVSKNDPYDNTLTNVYFFEVTKTLEKYKDIYNKYIGN